MSFKSNTGTIIDRAINELRTGRPLIIQNNKEYWMFFNIEHSQSKIFNQFNKHLIDEKYLLITKQKAQSIFNKNIKSNIFFSICCSLVLYEKFLFNSSSSQQMTGPNKLNTMSKFS